MCITYGYRAFHDLDFLLRLALFSLFLLLFNVLDYLICIKQIFLVYRLILRLCICFGKEDLYRHK